MYTLQNSWEGKSTSGMGYPYAPHPSSIQCRSLMYFLHEILKIDWGMGWTIQYPLTATL